MAVGEPLRPLDRRPGVDAKPSIVTMRRQPPRVVHARMPVGRRPPQPNVHASEWSWDQICRANHRRWDVKTGARLQAAKDIVAKGVVAGEGDELDRLVEIQRERQKRLASLRSAPPFVQRLHANLPPAPTPSPDPLDQFVAFAQAQALGAAPPPVSKPFQPTYLAERQPVAFVTRTGLNFA